MIPAFFLTPVGRRVAIGAGILVLVLFALRLYGNRQYSKGREDEKVTASQAIAKAANDARTAARSEIQKEREALNVEAAALAQSRAQFERDRKQVDVQLRDRLNAIATASRNDNARINQTSDDALDSLLRSLIGELRGKPATPTP